MPFAGDAHVAVQQISDTDWRLLRSLLYEGRRDPFEVPIDQETDFASIPRVFTWFLPRYGKYTKSAILHDYLWRELVEKEKTLSRIDADGIFRRSMRELDVAFLRRWIMWSAVRWAALLKEDGRVGWWRESWRVVLLTLLALPILLPPAAVILAALLAFYVLELVFWAPLKLWEVTRKRPTKNVVMPSVRLKT